MQTGRDSISYMRAKQLFNAALIAATGILLGSTASAATRDEPDLVVSWPAASNAQAVTFTIPGEYLHRGTTLVDKDGNVQSFAVLFELRGLKPLQERPWLKGQKGTPKYEAFMRRWQGRFAMDVSQTSTGGTAVMHSMRREMRNPAAGYLRDGTVAGLERYSRTACLDKRLKNAALEKAVALKGADDQSPAGCIMNRRSVVLIPPENTPGSEALGIRCMSTGCMMDFNAVGRTATIRFDHKDLKNWSKIKKAGQSLAQRFITY